MSRFRQLLELISALVLAGCIVATAAAYTAQWHWLLELFSHFRMQYVAILILLALFYAWRRRFLTVGIAAVCAGLNFIPIASVLATSVDTQVPAGTEQWVLLSANLNGHNDNVTAVLDNVAAEQPDVVVLQEYTFRWAANLAGLKTQYPHYFELPREDNFGLALYSRWPLASVETLALGDSTPAIVAELATAHGRLQVIGVHFLPPLTADRAAQRGRQFEALAKLAADINTPLAVVGDFNATPWSPEFRRWIEATGLHNGIDGRGVTYTWPTTMPIFRIPIDACVVNDGLTIVAQRRGNHIGSDHYPLVTTLVTNND